MDFNIHIPQEMIGLQGQHTINMSLLDNKYVVGVIGYSKSGKDSCAQFFIDEFGFKRIAFADKLKEELNTYCRDIVFEHLASSGDQTFSSPEEIDFFTEEKEKKTTLRQYMIWYSESIKKICGDKIWINKALSDAHGFNKIIITDTRRIPELAIFENSPYLIKRDEKFCYMHGLELFNLGPVNNFFSVLFEVSQLGLEDNDVLTHEALEYARRNWLIAETIKIDSRVPNNPKIRNAVLRRTLNVIVDKFELVKSNKQLPGQLSFF